MRLHLVLLVALALPPPAAAAPIVKLTCTSQGKPLPKKGKVPGTLECELSAKKLKGHAGPLKAALRVVTGELSSAPVEAQGPIAKDGAVFRFQLEPGTNFPPCERFDLSAEVSSSKGMLGKAKLAVPQDCPKTSVKGGHAALTCNSSAPDGTRYAYPGTGEKTRPRLVRELNCAIVLDKAPESGTVKGTMKVGKRTRSAEVREVSGGSLEAAATFFPDDDFPSCDSFTAEGELTVDGKSLWKGSIPIPQSCSR
ncbi:MAG TPA: hypothetical protein VGK67_38555 [Myxococcales bacterium]|jgi:hypothetical protein